MGPANFYIWVGKIKIRKDITVPDHLYAWNVWIMWRHTSIEPTDLVASLLSQEQSPHPYTFYGWMWEEKVGGGKFTHRVSSREITSSLLRDKLKETIMDRRISCLAYLIRKGCVEKLWSVSSILHTPYTSSEPKSGAATQTKVLLTRQQFSHYCKSDIVLSTVCFLCVCPWKGICKHVFSLLFSLQSKN